MFVNLQFPISKFASMIFTLKRPYQRWNGTSYEDPYKLLPAYTAFIAHTVYTLTVAYLPTYVADMVGARALHFA